MRRVLILVLLACLTLPAEAALAAADPVSPSSVAAEAERPARKKKVKQRASEWMRMYGVAGLRQRRITHLEYTGSDPLSRTDLAERGSYTCLKHPRGKRVMAYQPVSLGMSGNSFTHDWMLFIYRANRARKVDGRMMKQFEFCATGSGHTWNKWSSNFNGGAVSLKDRPQLRIGHNWGERVASDGGIHSTLSFELSAGVAKVSASTPVGIDDDHHFTGTQGWDPRLYLPDAYVEANQVNAYYESDDNWTFQGTDREVGNNLHVLYEVRQRARGGLHWVLGTKIAAHCTKWFQIIGRRCESFD